MMSQKLGQKPRALIFEADVLRSQEYTMALQAAGYTVFATDNLEVASDWLKNHVPTLVLIGLDGGLKEGEQLLGNVRNDARLDKTKIFLISKNVLSSRMITQSSDLLLSTPVTFSQLKGLSARYV